MDIQIPPSVLSNLLNRGRAPIFQNSMSHFKFLDARKVKKKKRQKKRKCHIEDIQVVGPTEQNLVAQPTCRLGHP